MGIKAFITGVAGTELTSDERVFLEEEHPFGLILFARNIGEPKMLSRLVDMFRESVERSDAPVFIDQEGGRVQRMGPPHWQSYASARQLGDLWQVDKKAGKRALYLHSRLIAHDLKQMHINANCLPVLDVPVKGSHDVIGDRAYSVDPKEVSIMGRIACEGLLDGGVLPVVKHIPGHGRALCDSHEALPEVAEAMSELENSDFVPFKALSDMPMAMTAHIRYHDLDAECVGTQSKAVIDDVIRGKIGFDGLLISDDLSMQALSGDLAERTSATLEAGCDIALHCNGDFKEMLEVASVCHVLEDKPLERAQKALCWLKQPDEIDVDALRAEYRKLLEQAA